MTTLTAQDRALHGAVNLLPWREAGIRSRRLVVLRQFVLVVFLACGMSAVGSYRLSGQVAALNVERAELMSSLNAMAPRVARANETANQLSRWRGFAAKVPIARHSHRRMVDFVRDLSAQSAAGVAIESVTFNGPLIEVKGVAQTKGMAVEFVRGVKARGWPASPPTVGAGDGSKPFAFLVKPKAKKKK